MRSPWLILSLLVHGAAIGTAVAVGAHAGPRTPRRAPHVELLSAAASTPAPAAVELPPVLVEDVPREPPRCDVEFVEPIPAPAPVAAWDLPVDEPAPLERVRVRKAAPAPSAPDVVEVAAAVAAPPPEAPASAFVDASPVADNAPPEYPASERASGHEGTVVVAVRVDARGDVVDVELRHASPYPGLNRAAMRAVRGWKFEPAQRAGIAVEGRIDVPVVFRLTDR